MNDSFQLVAIDHAPYQQLFDLTDEELNERLITRCIAQENPGYPCRVSLEDAQIGEELLLMPYAHQPEASPYRSTGPIFVRRGAVQRQLPMGQVPSYVTNRLISVRAYDSKHMMVAASVCEGVNVDSEITEYFKQTDIAYMHLHNAKRGCFSCKVVRA